MRKLIRTENHNKKKISKMCSLSYIHLIFILLLTIPLTYSSAQPLKCSSHGKTCNSIIDYMAPNATTFEEIKNLFTVSSLLALRGANNFPLNFSRNATITTGQKIKIPFPCACTNGTGLSNKQPVYHVAINDSLYSIATDVFAGLVTYQQIQRVNNISNDTSIEVGQKLWVPLPCSCDDVDGQRAVHYGHVVASGSTLGGIAQQYNVSENTLLMINNLNDPKDLRAGAVLDVPLRVCSSMISNASLDYPLLVPSNTYVFTATNCIMCNCSAENNWTLQCTPSALNSSCSPIRCLGEENLYIGETTSSGCNHTTCTYAGYTKNTLLTTLALESTCPASNNRSHVVSSDASEWKILPIFVNFVAKIVIIFFQFY